MSSATLEATVGLFDRFESELKALEARQRAATQTLHASEETQRELTGRIAELMSELKVAEGRVSEAQERGREITASAERQAFGVLNSAQKDAEAIREKFRVAIASAQAAFARLG
jgi:chromosome segregation ATPase